MATEQKRYAAAEVRDILRRAEQQNKPTLAAGDSTGLSAAELLDNAKDLGFSTQDVQTALVEYEQQREITVAEQELRQLSYRRLSTHAIFLTAVLGTLTVLGAWAAAGTPLALVMILWATLFLLQVRGALFPNPEALREQAKRRISARKLKESGKQLGSALASGAAKLMALSAQKIDEGVKQLDK